MTTTPINNPLPLFRGADGSALSNGYVYIGTANANPETSPVSVYWDAALTQGAAQPLRTSGGYIVRNGTPSPVFFSGSDCSMTVRDAHGAIVYYVASCGTVDGLLSLSAAVTQLSADLASTASSKGASLIGLQDAGDYFAATQIEAAIAELGLAKKRLVDCSHYPWLCDMTGVTESSAAFYACQTYANSIGAGVYIPAGTLLASIDIHYNNAVIRGAGHYVTTVKLPAWTVGITSISTAANVLTVICADTSKLWVGRSIRITGTTDATHNSGFLVTSVDSPTQFKCQQLNAVVTGTSTGGTFMAANGIDCGKIMDGNSATAYTWLMLRDFTVDANKSNRASPESDLTDWGVSITNFARRNVDIRCLNAHNGGFGAFINSNFGFDKVYVENCGFVGGHPGYDINSSKYFVCDVVSKDCNYGARVLDNSHGIVGRFTIYNATVTGFLAYNQTVNESHNCNFAITVEGGCTTDGVQIGTNFRNSSFACTVNGVTGIGVREVYVATAANRPGSNRVTATTKGCGLQAAVIGGDGSTWDVVSYLDGRTGAAGSVYAVQIDGQRNIVTANVTDSATPQVRGVTLTATSVGNRIDPFVRNTLVSDFNDSGSGNTWTTRVLRGSKTYDAPNLAAGAQTSTTITVTGATTGSGDIAEVRYANNIGGISIYAEVTAADTVTAWLTNLTSGAIDLASGTIYATVTKATP